jgi:hypothetical protein
LSSGSLEHVSGSRLDIALSKGMMDTLKIAEILKALSASPQVNTKP